jgi:exodeoxyribonuclease VII small subunit
MKTNLSYKQAFSALEKLVEQIEDDKIPLEQLAEKVKEANAYIRFCEARLRGIETDVEAALLPGKEKKKKAKSAESGADEQMPS